MKKIIAVVLALVTILACFAGCGAEKTDLEYIKEKGEMIIGITYFEPMNYIDKETNELTGFETEFAKAVCEELGVTAKFQEINWDSKETELNSKTIDCIWNGMTITDDRLETMGISTPYMSNTQVFVVKKENEAKFNSAESLKGLTVVAEKGSAGEETIQGEDFFKEANYIPVDTMAKAIMEVSAGTADACVIDYVTSVGMIGEGTDYDNLVVIDKNFANEEYGIAMRKEDTELVKAVNDAIQKVADSGKLNEIASKYKLQDRVLVKAK